LVFKPVLDILEQTQNLILHENLFATLIAFFLIVNTRAQIVYTDITDFTGTGIGTTSLKDSFDLDLNNDATIDFQFIMWNHSGTVPHHELKVDNIATTSRIGISYDDQFIASMAYAKNSGDSITPD